MRGSFDAALSADDAAVKLGALIPSLGHSSSYSHFAVFVGLSASIVVAAYPIHPIA
jgi:hypothetical protein